MTNNQFITIGKYILIEYLKNPATFTKRISGNRVLLAEGCSPRGRNVYEGLKDIIEQIVLRKNDWLQICNGRLAGKIVWQPTELGLVMGEDDKGLLGLDPSTMSIYSGLDLHWSEVVLYDLIGRAFAAWIKNLA